MTIDLFNFALIPTCIALYTQCFPSVCRKNFTDDSGGIRTHDLLLTSADVPLDHRACPMTIGRLESWFRDIHRLMKFLFKKTYYLLKKSRLSEATERRRDSGSKSRADAKSRPTKFTIRRCIPL